MEKKTAKEIVAILEESGISVSSFAYGDIEIPSDFEFSDAVENAKKVREEASELYTNHPGYRDASKRDDEFTALKDAYFALPSHYEQENIEYFTSLGLGKITQVESYGGEDQGSTWYVVNHFVDHDIYIKTDGWYTSYHGTDFHDGFGQEVFPAEKVVKYFATEAQLKKS